MRPHFKILSAVAIIFGVSGMAYYYQSVPVRPTSLTAQVAESAAEAAAGDGTIPDGWGETKPPFWQTIYPAYDIGSTFYRWWSGSAIPAYFGNGNSGTLPAKVGLPMEGWVKDEITWTVTRGLKPGLVEVPSYFDAVVGNRGVVVRDLLFEGNDSTKGHKLNTVGSLAVTPGTEVLLEWACMDRQQGTGWSAPGFDGAHGGYEYWLFMRYYQDWQGPKATNFIIPTRTFPGDNTKIPYPVGGTIVKPTKTTTYTLQCRGARIYGTNNYAYSGTAEINRRYYPCSDTQGVCLTDRRWVAPVEPTTDATMPLTVYVCSESVARTSAGAYKLESKKTQLVNISVDGKTYNFCLTNPTNNDYLIPGGSVAEMDKFVAAIPSLGLVIK